jgi:5-methylthioadenosine/S-adenosylhomocysteine deaminase
VGYVWIPRFVLSCSEALVRGAAERALTSGALLHTHCAEHPGEQRAVRRRFGADDLALFRRWGVRGPRASLAHCVQLTPRQIRILAEDGTSVVHCPSANLKLGSGIAPVPELRAAGVRVGLGADGAPCNNNLDPFIEMRHAALLAALRSGPGVLSAGDVLAMATMDGARLLGLERHVGSVELGKQADLVVVKLDGPHVAPALDPVSAIVYAAQARDVEHVLVAGRFVVRGGRLLTLDAERVAARARQELARLLRRAAL